MAAEENHLRKNSHWIENNGCRRRVRREITFDAIPAEAIRIGTRCLLDGLGLFVAGSEEHTVQLLVEDAEQTGGRPDALLLSRGNDQSARADGSPGARHRRPCSRLGRQPGEHRPGACVRALDSSHDSAAIERAGDGAKARRHRRQDFHARFSHRLRSRVQDLRMDAAAALRQRNALQRHRRHLRRLRRGGETARVEWR